MPRRLKAISGEDLVLWERVVATARPLGPPVSPPAAALPAAPPPPGPAPALPPRPAAAPPRAAPPPTRPGPSAPALDRRRFEKLRRGRLEPEARLDLHGMTAERAHAALTGFVTAAHAAGHRLVLVITGKGRSVADGGALPVRSGILRHSVPHWLSAPPLGLKVLEVVPAHARHGGGGALYVYLRRVR